MCICIYTHISGIKGASWIGAWKIQWIFGFLIKKGRGRKIESIPFRMRANIYVYFVMFY